MNGSFRKKIEAIVDGKLNIQEIEELVSFIKGTFDNSGEASDEGFFRDLAFEMSASAKDLALLIVASSLLFFSMFTGKKRLIDRWEGVIFLILYFAYNTMLLM